MVALGTFIITTLLPMLGPCFGVVFSRFLLDAGTSSATTAWIFNIQCFTWNMSALFNRPLTQEFGWRPVGMTTGLLASLGLVISAFAPVPEFLFFSYSILTGFGGGIITCQCFTILPHYFLKRRGLANAIMMSGVCLGQFIGPPIARYLQDTYGFQGATMILGGILLNSCIGAIFFHPFEWHTKKVPRERHNEEEKPKSIGRLDLPRGLNHCPSEASFDEKTSKEESDLGAAVNVRLLGILEPNGKSGLSSRRSSRYNSTISLASMEVPGIAGLAEETTKVEEETDQIQCSSSPICGVVSRVVLSTVADLGSLGSLRTCILSFAAMMCINGYLNFIMMVPFAMLEAGHSLDTSAWGLSVSAICNLVARFLVSVLSDSPRFNMKKIYVSGFFVIAFSITVFTFVESSVWLLVCLGLFGSGVGANMGLYNLVIIDVMGVASLSKVFGTMCFSVAIGFICMGPVIGFIRDATQSYAVSMRITGGMLFISFISWLFMPVAERIDRRREVTRQEKQMNKELPCKV